ncbi:LPS assembly protein LptD [Lysobacter niastensis]|uniref:LPS assembly protein LptD n=1 Tax=Lysobacter niastensis TaxID=380629 RepID=UPI003621399C
MRNRLRLLPLSLCIALALPAQAAEGEDWRLCPIEDVVPPFAGAPTPTTTVDQRATQPTDIEGDTLEANQGTDAVFQGNVSLNRGDQLLHTDKLTYSAVTDEYVAEGNVHYQDSAMRVTADRAVGNQKTDTHRIEDVRYQLTDRRGNGGAERIELSGDNGTLVHSTYSTCAPSERAWELRAREIDVDSTEGVGVAKGATLRIGNVPIMYMPWFMFPVDDRRKSGLLYPGLSLSGRNGFDYKQPIYLNLAPNYDATLTPRIMTDRGTSLGGEFRWLYENGSGTMSGNWMPTDDLPDHDPGRYTDAAGVVIPRDQMPDKNRGQFVLNAKHNINSDWYANANLGWISDLYYLQDFSNSLYGVSAYSIRSSAGLYGRGRYWDASLMADHYQLADYTLTDENLPFDRLPRAHARWAQPFATWLEAGADGEAVRFHHDVFGGGSRLDLKPYISMPLAGASWFLLPKIAWRYTTYQLDSETAADVANSRARQFAIDNGIAYTPDLDARFYDKTPNRSLPIASLDAGLFFDRSTSFRGDRYLHTLEPRIYYLNAPFRNQDALPLFDTNTMTFSWGQLFRDNRYTGADRQIDANQITAALTTRFISENDGRERLSASLGQIHYLDDSRVTVPGETPLEQGKSAWVAEASVSPGDRWNISAAYQWDPKFRREDLASLRARYLLRDFGIVNLGYRYRRDLVEQADFSFLYPINDTWSVVGRYYYSFLDRKPLESLAGVQWESCCLAIRLVARRYLNDRSGDLNNSLQVEFELKGLSSIGQDTERVLRRAILGYDRDDLYLVPPSSVQRLNNSGDAANSIPDPTL